MFDITKEKKNVFALKSKLCQILLKESLSKDHSPIFESILTQKYVKRRKQFKYYHEIRLKH